MYLLKSDLQACNAVVSALKQEQIVVLPTDTIYGFSGVMSKTAEKIARIKGREADKQFLALIAQPDDVYLYTSKIIPDILLSYWPGPLTVIVPLKTGGTQAFRCPADEWLRDVIRSTGVPIYSTSVNYAGQRPFTDIDAIVTEFEDSVSLVIDAGLLTGLPSTIVDICGEEPRVIRSGAVQLDL